MLQCGPQPHLRELPWRTTVLALSFRRRLPAARLRLRGRAMDPVQVHLGPDSLNLGLGTIIGGVRQSSSGMAEWQTVGWHCGGGIVQLVERKWRGKVGDAVNEGNRRVKARVARIWPALELDCGGACGGNGGRAWPL